MTGANFIVRRQIPEGEAGWGQETGPGSIIVTTGPNNHPNLFVKSVYVLLAIASAGYKVTVRTPISRRRGLLAPSLTVWFLAAFWLAATSLAQQRPVDALAPTELPGLHYTNDFFPGTSYRGSVPTVQAILGFPAGDHAATSMEIERCLKAWTNAAPDRTLLVEYARSHEDRALHYLVVTSPKNLARLEEIRAGTSKLGDPRSLPDSEAAKLTNNLPAVAWLGHTIHGDETEGSDAALALLYHLIAAEDPAVTRMLERLVVIVDPLMNPDGRDRFLKQIAENRGAMPNVDDQSLLHEGYWPQGRGNHYLFDLNRDWMYGVHPETRGRIREIARWNPVLLIDAHGMGAQDTHLFSPPREPLNPHLPEAGAAWYQLFASEQSRALDRQQYLYYRGEWNEGWFPGYSDAWIGFRGGIGILYEQARIAEDGVRRPEGRILSYRESVRHHVVSAMSNLGTAQANAAGMLGYFYTVRKAAIDPAGRYANHTFALLPTANRSRLRRLLADLELQGIEVFVAPSGFSVPLATDQLGRERRSQDVPAGSILIPNRQPLGNLVGTMLEFDPRMKPAALADEREELLRKGQSRIYDTTAWNLTMMYGVEALDLAIEPPQAATRWHSEPAATGVLNNREDTVAYVVDGGDDGCLGVAARLMERGVEVRAAEKAFQFDNRDFSRGSIVITRLDNRDFSGNLTNAIDVTGREFGVPVTPIAHGLGPGESPSLGGGYFRRLQPLRIALLAREGYNSTDYGSLWLTLDQQLGIRHTHLEDLQAAELARYNVLIVPERSDGPLEPGQLSSLKEWVKGGGTLIVIGGAVEGFASEKADFGKARLLPEVLGKLADYELAVLREWLAQGGKAPEEAKVWAHKAEPGSQYPWQGGDGGWAEEKELKKRDAWQALFTPQGAFLAARIDRKHWLTAGCRDYLSVLVGPQPVLIAADGVEAPVRLGYLTAADAKPNPEQTKSESRTGKAEKTDKPGHEAGVGRKPSPETKPDADSRKASAVSSESDEKEGSEKKDKKERPRIGWAAAPEGYEMYLRMSGLLWPEAAQRLANSAYLTREGLGRGQIILFAGRPTFRGCAQGTTRLFLNAVVLGPGFGATQPIRP